MGSKEHGANLEKAIDQSYAMNLSKVCPWVFTPTYPQGGVNFSGGQEKADIGKDF